MAGESEKKRQRSQPTVEGKGATEEQKRVQMHKAHVGDSSQARYLGSLFTLSLFCTVLWTPTKCEQRLTLTWCLARHKASYACIVLVYLKDRYKVLWVRPFLFPSQYRLHIGYKYWKWSALQNRKGLACETNPTVFNRWSPLWTSMNWWYKGH